MGKMHASAGTACGLVALASFLLIAVTGAASAQQAQNDDPWPELKSDFFQNRPIVEDPKIVSLQAPERAEDAAIVPVKLTAAPPPGDPRRVVKLTLIIDENPMPLAAAFTLGEKAGLTSIATRVRVNSYTNIHLIAELSDGSLYSATRYIKAAGGCSAPMAKTEADAAGTLGQTKFHLLSNTPDGRREAQIMLRHPNNSGMQMDQITHLYTPARFIDHLTVNQGADRIFSMEGGISISEDPNFRFNYIPNGSGPIRMEASDSTGKHFSAAWPAERNGA